MEKRPNDNTGRSYQVRLVDTRFELPTQIESLLVNGVSYTPKFMGSGEFKNNSVTITRTASFTESRAQPLVISWRSVTRLSLATNSQDIT
ncbi:hypothetical protein GCM10028819_44750 [Spirosoma humi]